MITYVMSRCPGIGSTVQQRPLKGPLLLNLTGKEPIAYVMTRFPGIGSRVRPLKGPLLLKVKSLLPNLLQTMLPLYF